jgi:AdoMet-dependent rRNA methyltransferase SPB1
MDSDAIAETVAIAKEMLRKKRREEIIDSSYNRYAFDDEKNSLPIWFKEDEDKHSRPQLPVTREMINAEKERMKEFNLKTPKKVCFFIAYCRCLKPRPGRKGRSLSSLTN